MPDFRKLFLPTVLFLTLATTLGGYAQSSQPGRAESPIQASLQWLAARSAVIFTGEVLPTEAVTADEVAAASMPVINIRVEAGIRGARAGAVISLRRLHGSDGFLLAPHERILLFLRPLNAAGSASSAYGSFGMLRIGGGDRVDLRALVLLWAQFRAPGGLLLQPPPFHRGPCHGPGLRPEVGAPPQWLEGCDPGVGIASKAGEEGAEATSTRQLIEMDRGPLSMPIKQLLELLSGLAADGQPYRRPVLAEVHDAR